MVFAFHFVGEWPHAAVEVFFLSLWIGFEKQPACIEDAEEMFAGVKTVGAKHGFGADIGLGTELVQNEGFKGIIGHNGLSMVRAI